MENNEKGKFTSSLPWFFTGVWVVLSVISFTINITTGITYIVNAEQPRALDLTSAL